MNQIFRVIWNHATQSWVAVSELTKAHKKQSRNSLKAVLGGALVLCSINTAEAGVAIGSTSNNTLDKGTALASDSGIAIGKNANASKENNNIAIGDDTNSNGAYNIVIGKNAVAGSDGRGNERRVGQSVAIGGGNKAWEGAKSFGDQSVALGANTLAYGNSSIAIGNDDVDRAVAATTTYTNSDGNKVTGTVGAAYTNLTGKNLHTDGGRYKDTKSGEAAIAIGVKAQAGDISVALGTGAQAEKVNATALGSGATATFDNSVALGGGSVTDKEGTKQTSVTVNGHTYNWSGGSTTGKGDVVSIGKAGYERQLKNVAAGEVSETSTDGINGSQLHGILNNMTLDPTFLYAGDDADKGEVTGADADAKKTDATKKKIVVRSMKDGRLNLLGGATGDLSENNIAVKYGNDNTLNVKLAKDLKDLTSTNVGGIVTNADGINMNNKPITNVAGNLPGAKEGTEEPTTASEGPAAADLPNIKKNAATVGDVLNAGWNLQNNGNAKDLVKPYDTVNFVNGTGTVAVVETDEKGLKSNVTFNVDTAEMTPESDGTVTGPVPQNLLDALDKAKEEAEKNPNDAAAKKALEDAEKAVDEAGGNKVATAQNVADMINNSGFTLKADKVDSGENTTDGNNENGDKLTEKGELIKPGSTVTMKAGKNMTVKHEVNGNITYATKDDVEFNSVTVGPKFVDEQGNPVTKVGDKYLDKDGKEVPADKVKPFAPVAMKTEKATPANNNQDGKSPTTALNVTSTDGKPTQITGVGSVLSNESIPTNTNGTPTAQDKQPKLVNLGTKPDENGKVTPLPDNVLNSAATVRDLANMGWVVGAPENGYVDTVKNANKVDFKGENGISVTGKTNDKGVREITIAVKDGEVVKPNQFTAKVNGTDTPVTKVGDQYYNTADIDPKTGKPKADKKPVTPDAGTTPTNAGDGYVTGNKVAAAIQKSGFVVGKQKDALSAADFKDEDEKVNPDDELRFADGNNTKVKLATKESVDKDGNKVTTTTVKVDVTGLPVQYTAKVNGKDTPVTKVGDKYFTVDDKGNPTTTEVAPADLTTNMVNPAAKPNEIGAPTTLGNVKSNLPSVNDADKNAKDVDGNPIAGKDNKSAPIDAAKAADIAKNVGNNAATVSDVLNAGWNLQNNGKAKDFVKPYDTVNFVDGKGTKAVVKTEEDGTTSNVKFDIDTGSITNNADGSVQGPVVTPEMTKALEDATNTLNNLPATAPAAVRKAAEQAVADAANNIANVANKVATAQDVANAINKSGFTLTTSANGGEKISGTPEMINPGKKVEMVAGKNMTVKQESNGKVTYATASNVTFDSVQFGDNGPKITNNGGNINVGTATGAPTKITGVAPGEISATSKDAVNGSQLYAMGNKLQGQINKLGKRMNAGMATSAAMANLLQPHKSGQSVVTAGVGQHKNQSAVAVGYSRLSDNGKYGVRFSMGANTQGEVTGGAAVGYFW